MLDLLRSLEPTGVILANTYFQLATTKTTSKIVVFNSKLAEAVFTVRK
jgi:hypothetical protein